MKKLIYSSNVFELDLKNERDYLYLSALLSYSKIKNDKQQYAIKTLHTYYNEFRRVNNLDCVVGFVTVDDDKSGYAVIFKGVKSENDKHYRMRFDEETLQHYIEV